MILRIVLSIVMLVPAAPVNRAKKDCPFDSKEECLAWLELCCGPSERSVDLCVAACGTNFATNLERDEADIAAICCAAVVSCQAGKTDEVIDSCFAACLPDEPQPINVQCCSAHAIAEELIESPLTESEAATGCCAAHREGNDAEPTAPLSEGDAIESESPIEAELTCEEHCSPRLNAVPCDWCCCCPVRPIRIPEPQAPVTVVQRSATEKESRFEIQRTGDRKPNAGLPDYRWDGAAKARTVCGARLSIICVWLK